MPPFVGESVINHSKDVLEETYNLWDYFDEKRDALERLENYLVRLRASGAAAFRNASAHHASASTTTVSSQTARG